jgi:hypothetical protein
MAQKIKVKDAKAKLQSLLDELNKIDENADFVMEVDDCCGGSYYSDINNWSLIDYTKSIEGNVWLGNF